MDTIPSIAQMADNASGSLVDKRRLWARELLELTPVNDTGSLLYTNAGYIIVGSMLETVTGSDWETLIADQLLGPLGMTNTGFGAPGTSGQFDQPLGHLEENGSLVPVRPGRNTDNPQALRPASTVHTTLSDYAQYMFARLEGQRGIPGLKTAETFRFLHTPVRNSSYALGWEQHLDQEWAEGPIFSHAGSNLRWWANAGLVPGLNVGLFMVTNAADDAATDGADELGQLLIQRMFNSR